MTIRRFAWQRMPWLLVAVCSLFWFVASQAEAPSSNGDIHLGVASCAGSPCHGSALGKKATAVLQNEYLTWQREDKHAKAFLMLQGERGRRIAANLGINSADAAPECLGCHADNVALERRGVQFHLSDGVGCEACHGGSEHWLGPHATGRVPHGELVAENGLYPTEDPMKRAELCLRCHWGDESNFVTHRIMGAGHPRLAFELQTFTQIEPAHYVVDDIYHKRKTVPKGVQVWAVGQAIALERMMISLQEAKHRGNGVFPELVFFDCDACHHAATNLRWSKRASSGLGPGEPHFNDSNALMLHAIARRLAPEDAVVLDRNLVALHGALSEGKGDSLVIAKQVGDTAHRLAELLAHHDFSSEDMRSLIGALAQRAREGDAVDYAGAEQMTMASASIISTLRSDGALDAPHYATLKSALDQCYAATQKEDQYEPAKFVAALNAIEKALP